MHLRLPVTAGSSGSGRSIRDKVHEVVEEAAVERFGKSGSAFRFL